MSNTVEVVTITRTNDLTGREHTRDVYIVGEWPYLGLASGRPVIVTNQPGHPHQQREILSAAEQATIRTMEVSS